MKTPKIFQKGMAAQAGEALDKVKDNLKGAGTMEKAGIKVDKAGKEVGNAVKNAFKK